MKEKSTTKVVRVDDEIEVVVSERSSIDSSLEGSIASSHDDGMYPLVIAGNHGDVFVDDKDEKEVTFKVHGTIPSIKTEDNKLSTKSIGNVFDNSNSVSVTNSMYINQQVVNFQCVKSEMKEETDMSSSTDVSSSRHFASNAEFCCGDAQDKDPRLERNISKLVVKDSSQDSSRSFLWHGSGVSGKSYPTYSLESDGRLSNNLFSSTNKVVSVKEEKTCFLDFSPPLSETGAALFKLDRQSPFSSEVNKSSKDFSRGCIDTSYQHIRVPKSFMPNNAGSAISETNVSHATKEPAKEKKSLLDTILQHPHPKKGKKRELDLLYDNLKEISWAQDKSFANLLGDKQVHKRLERISNTKGGHLASRRKVIGISIGKKIIKKVSAQQRKCLPKSKDVKKISKEIQANHAKFFKTKISEKQKIKWHNTSDSKSVKNRNVNSILEGKKLVKLKPKLSEKINCAPQVKKHGVVSEQSKLSGELKTSGKQSTNSSSKKLQTNKVARQDERKKKELLKSVCSKMEHGELGELTDDSGSHVSESLPKGPELRVTIEPLENPDIWTSDIFKKRSFHQSAFKGYSCINQGNVESVLRGVNDSIMMRNNVKTARKRKYEEESIRTSIRQSECAFRYKEIVVKKHSNYMQVVLVPNALKQNCLSIEAMKELREAFVSAKKDSNCKAVLLNSSGSFFCSGVDLSQLLGPNKKQVAEEMALTVRDLIMTIGHFQKPVVAAVNGCAVGLGVTLLTFCDIVLASDKATFCIPAVTLGHVPEGGVALTLPQVVGSTVAVEMLLQGRKLTAEQALKYGLVNEVLWPTQLMENVVPRMQMLVSQSLQVMSATKTMVRCYLWEKLALQLDQEWHVISTQWQQPTCQQNIKKALQAGWLSE